MDRSGYPGPRAWLVLDLDRQLERDFGACRRWFLEGGLLGCWAPTVQIDRGLDPVRGRLAPVLWIGQEDQHLANGGFDSGNQSGDLTPTSTLGLSVLH